jgi:hypothetical protein
MRGRKRCVVGYAVGVYDIANQAVSTLSTRDFASATASVSDFAIAFDVKQSIIGRSGVFGEVVVNQMLPWHSTPMMYPR